MPRRRCGTIERCTVGIGKMLLPDHDARPERVLTSQWRRSDRLIKAGGYVSIGFEATVPPKSRL
ncbi:hypothetical protein AGR7B_pAt0075 [Agrobacterium deltaense RV3]|nr:hypothetical protein AGR7B_pAt0075 [Agrobacterium deltaense RV3]